MTLIYGTAVTASGQPAVGRRVTLQPSRGGIITAGLAVAAPASTITDRNGYWQLNAIPNASITPPNTHYILRQFGMKFFISVPDSASPLPATALLLDDPSNPLPPHEYVHDIGGYSGSINAETLSAIIGGVEGGESLITSIDGRTGVVTLSDRYATLLHNHNGVYAPLGHTHDYAATSHNHDGTYLKPADQAVTSVAGLTGAVVLDGVYSSLGHTHDMDTSEHTHAEYSLVSHDHDSRYPLLAHNHAASYSALGHLHDARYVQLGNETVTSVNGQTGDVTIEGGGGPGGAVDSVDGQTGTVDLTGSYAPLSHNHNSVYATLVHNHDSAYSALAHNHTGVYSPVAHTHTYPVTSVDGLTGAVSLSSTYATTGHNHDASYSALAHNHDATYSVLAHTHSALTTTVSAWTALTNASFSAGNFEWRFEYVNGGQIVRLRTRGLRGSVLANATLATLPVGSRPSADIRIPYYQNITAGSILIASATGIITASVGMGASADTHIHTTFAI